ncbi:MAG: Rnf-Nqr domain containing protein, partial [Faecalibacterium sp.]
MKTEREQEMMDEVSYQLQRDRIFSNNPVVMQGMGLAPLVVVATTAENALMLAVAVLIMLTPTRIIANFILCKVKPKLLRAMGYTLVAAITYAGAYLVLSFLFGVKMLNLGIYLPMLVVEPLMIYRFARPIEPFYKTVIKGLKMTLGYAIVLGLVGCLREFFAAGTIYGIALLEIDLLPLASTPAGGFILLG